MVVTYAGATYKRRTRANYMLGRISRGIAQNARNSLSRIGYGTKNFRTMRKSKRGPPNLTVPNQSAGQYWFPRLSYAPMPRKKTVQLKYVSDQKTVACTVGGAVGVTHQYALNGLFDPEITGGGHQPMGFDQMMAWYNNYRVWKVEFKIRWSAPSSTSTMGVAQISASNDTDAGSLLAGQTYTTVAERNNCATKLINQDDDDSNTMYRSVYISGIEGQSIIDNNYTGRSTLNPTNIPILRIGCANAAGSDGNTVTYHLEIIYHADFFMRKSLGQS